MTSVRKLRSIISVALAATAGLLAAIISPLTLLFALISVIAFLAIAKQLNFYRIVMMIKSWAKNISRIRFEIRAKLHTGFRDYNDPPDAEGSHSSGRCCYAR